MINEINTVYNENILKMKNVIKEVKQLKNEVEDFDNNLILLKNNLIKKIITQTDFVITLEKELFPNSSDTVNSTVSSTRTGSSSDDTVIQSIDTLSDSYKIEE